MQQNIHIRIPFDLPLSLSNSLISGFHMACAEGPLCEEPLAGVMICLEGVWRNIIKKPGNENDADNSE